MQWGNCTMLTTSTYAPRPVRKTMGGLVALGLSVLLAACSSSSGTATKSAVKGRSTHACARASRSDLKSGVRTMSFGGAERQYTLHLPPGYDGNAPLPVILNLHGFTSTMSQQDTVSNLPEMGGKRGYAVVTPQALKAQVPVAGGGAQPFWNIIPLVAPAVDTGTTQPVAGTTDDLGFLKALLDTVEHEHCIDTTREYVTGISLGGAMTEAMACENDQRFAAIAPISGINIVKVCQAKKATPTIAFHGDADPLVPYTGGGMFGYDLGLPPVEQRLGEIAKLGGCNAGPTTSSVAKDVRLIRWQCPAGMAVELYKVLGGGHTWPGAGTYLHRDAAESAPSKVGRETESIVATKLILDFFDSHRQ
jgi:polyhydroxybutyrate depolymerase